MIKKIVLGLVAVVLIGAGFAYYSYGSIARAGSGYAAKNICSGYFLSGFSPEVTTNQALRGASELLANISSTVDEEKRATMVFDNKIELQHDVDRAIRDVWYG